MGTETIHETDYKAIEAQAAKIIKDKQKFERLVLTKAQAMEMFADNPFKLITVKDKVPDGGLTSAYRCGPLIDLCLGPHIPDTGRIKCFAIKGHSSSYYAGDKENDSLQRVYCAAFPEKKNMTDWEEQCKLIAEFDHRKVGAKPQL